MSLQMPLTAAGLTPPPATVHLKLLPAKDRHRLLVWHNGESSGAVARWVADQAEVQRTPGFEPGATLESFDMEAVPEAWTWWRHAPSVQHAVVAPEGQLTLTVHGKGAELERFLAELPEANVNGRPLDATTTVTARQHEAMAQAETAGYYTVPRRVRLQDVADEMGISKSALSELLRRGECKLVKAYIHRTPAPGVLVDGARPGWPDSQTPGA